MGVEQKRAAFARARDVDAERPRPYRVPGGKLVARLMAALCIGMISICLAFIMYVPGEGLEWSVVLGTLAAIALGEIAIKWSEKRAPEGARLQATN